MVLVIEKNDKYDRDFVDWLLLFIRKLLIESIDMRRLKLLAEYISEDLVPINVVQLRYQLVIYILSLHVEETRDAYIIQPAHWLMYKDVPLSTICSIVEYGTLSIKGLLLFNSVYAYIERRIDALYNMYCGLFIARF